MTRDAALRRLRRGKEKYHRALSYNSRVWEYCPCSSSRLATPVRVWPESRSFPTAAASASL